VKLLQFANFAGLLKHNVMQRRRFLQLSGFASSVFILGFRQSALAGLEAVAAPAEAASFDFTPFIGIDASGRITIVNTRPDIGQGTWQSVPGIIADELEVALEQVNILPSDGQKRFGPDQFAGGSMSIRSSFEALRNLGAAAREMLTTAAARQWQVPEAECYAENAHIIHRPTGKKSPYGDLAAAAAALKIPESPRLKLPEDFKIIGKSYPRPDVPLKVNGQAVYGIDVEVPGMLYATIEHCPIFGGVLKGYDMTETRNTQGVLHVFPVDRVIGIYKSTGVAVVASNYWAALKGRKALKTTWDYQGRDKFNSEDYTAELRRLASTEGIEEKSKGNFVEALHSAATQLEALYETPLVSHSPLEPMNCTAWWKPDNRLEIWASTQVPGDVVSDFARDYGIPPENITVHVTFSGGGFGRRLFNDVIVEAVNLSKFLQKPVKLIWTREDDTQLGPFRPMTFSALKAGLDTAGHPVAFQHKVISPSIDAALRKDYDRTKPDETMMEAISSQEYDIPNVQNRYVFADFHIPLGYWRAVTSTTLAFAHECFIDELADKAGINPLDYRLSMLATQSDTARLLRKLREVSNWDAPLPKGHGKGMAQWVFFAGHSAQAVEVAVQADGSVKIEQVWAVIDMGTVVNPDTVKAQVEGAVVMAITAATKNGITVSEGRVVQSNFHDNPLLRLAETPPIEVHILAEGGPVIKGAGEPGLPPLAPALANAIFRATGKRHRKMPFDL
jgi:isoquinoline 1-oxidoreductase beta subunit